MQLTADRGDSKEAEVVTEEGVTAFSCFIQILMFYSATGQSSTMQ